MDEEMIEHKNSSDDPSSGVVKTKASKPSGSEGEKSKFYFTHDICPHMTFKKGKKESGDWWRG